MSPAPFFIGEYAVFPASNEIHRGSEKVQIEPKVMELLAYLANNAGETLSREQIFQAVWPGLIVSDDTLTQAVIKLRKALGDSARNSLFIQTVPKRGYRLCAAVKPFPAGDHKLRLDHSLRVSDIIAGLMIIVLVAGVGAGYLVYRDNDREKPLQLSNSSLSQESSSSLTVLPFRAIGENATYLAQGITFDLITDLSRLSGLWVIGSRSIMGQKPDQPAQMNARYQVSGEVQRSDGKLRVQVHLFDAESGIQLWSDRYLRSFDNLFDIQEEMSRNIATTLSLKVSEAEQARMARRYTQNIGAYEDFLQAQSMLLLRQRTENEKAQELYRQAIATDPTFARAYAGLALSYAAEFRNQWSGDGGAALENAHRMALTSLQLDPEIPEIYWVLAYVSTQQREHDKAIGLLKKAISLDHSFADAYALMGGVNTYRGRTLETPELIHTAIRLNPDAGYLYFLLLGRAYFFLGDWEQAEINLREALARNPTNLEGHLYLSAVLESIGDHDGAVWEAEEVRSLQKDFNPEAWLKTYPMSDETQLGELLGRLKNVGF